MPLILVGIPWPDLRGSLQNHFWKKRRAQPYWGGENSVSALEASSTLNYRVWGFAAVRSRGIPGRVLRAFPCFLNFFQKFPAVLAVWPMKGPVPLTGPQFPYGDIVSLTGPSFSLWGAHSDCLIVGHAPRGFNCAGGGLLLIMWVLARLNIYAPSLCLPWTPSFVITLLRTPTFKSDAMNSALLALSATPRLACFRWECSCWSPQSLLGVDGQGVRFLFYCYGLVGSAGCPCTR